MKKPPLWSLIVLVSASAPFAAQAQLGSKVVIGGPQATCRLTVCDTKPVIGEDGQVHQACVRQTSTCTGTLISPTEVLTAGHCVEGFEDQKVRMLVQCGFQGTDQKSPAAPGADPISNNLMQNLQEDLSENFDSAQFAEQVHVAKVTRNPHFIDEEGSNGPGASCLRDLDAQYEEEGQAVKTEPTMGPGVDVAVLTLTQPAVKVAPMPIGNASDYFTYDGIRPGTECQIAGFGLGADGASGLLKSGPLSEQFEADMNDMVIEMASTAQLGTQEQTPIELLQYLAEVGLNMPLNDMIAMFVYLNSKHLVSTQMMPGASGGPLYCRASATDPWRTVGVNDAIAVLPECPKVKSSKPDSSDSDDSDDSIETRVRMINIWGIPNLSRVTQVLADYSKPETSKSAEPQPQERMKRTTAPSFDWDSLSDGNGSPSYSIEIY